MIPMLDRMYGQLDFHEIVLLQRRGASLFQSLHNGLNGKTVPLAGRDDGSAPSTLDLPLLLSSAPGYLDFRYRKGQRARTVGTYPGSLLNLRNYSNFEAYRTQTFSGKKLAQFRNSWELLNLCFDIRHQVHFGAMERTEYDRVFKALREQHAHRMRLMGERDDTAGMWDTYWERAYQQLLAKEACISVIYHGERPIAISLNFILGGIVHGFARSFDMAYSKFSLGNLELLKMIEWCFARDFDILDFMKGEYAYKSKFTDTPYTFTLQLLHDERAKGQRAMAVIGHFCLRSFYRLFHALKSLGLHRAWKRTKKALGQKGPALGYGTRQLAPPAIPGARAQGEYTRIPWEAVDRPVLQRAIVEFCHGHKTPLKAVQIYKPLEGPGGIKLIHGADAILVHELHKGSIRQQKI